MDGIIAAIPAIISLIEGLVPGASTGTAGTILNAIEPLVPVVIKEVRDLLPNVRNIIAALREKQLEAADWDRLVAMEILIDADFEAAAKDA